MKKQRFIKPWIIKFQRRPQKSRIEVDWDSGARMVTCTVERGQQWKPLPLALGLKCLRVCICIKNIKYVNSARK